MNRRSSPAARPGALRLASFGIAFLFLLTGIARAHPYEESFVASAGGSGPVEGTDVLVNAPGADEQGPHCNIQSEVSIARSGDNVVAAWNDGGQCDRIIRGRLGLDDGVGLSITGFGYSSDGGRTWVDGGVDEGIDGGVLTPPEGQSVLGDPVLAVGPAGDFYLATLIGTPSRLLIGVSRSTDGGKTWSVPVNASIGRNPNADQDKPWIAVDTTGSAYRGTIYVAWTEVLGSKYEVLFSRSTDHGQTFSQPLKLSVPLLHRQSPLDEYPGIGTQVAVGPDGQVYVGWVQTQSINSLRRIWLTRSIDGGEEFDLPVFVARAGLTGHAKNCMALGDRNPPIRLPGDPLPSSPIRNVINGDIRVGNWLSMAVDTSGSSDPDSAQYNPYRGNIYLAVPDDQTPRPVGGQNVLFWDESDIAFLYSEDGGSTWENVEERAETPIAAPDIFVSYLVSDDDDTDTDQFHPQLAVDSEGRVAVTWYDRRSDPENLDMEIWGRVSTDGGKTFGELFPISDRSFPPARTNPNTGGFGGCYMGEYNGMVGGDGEFLLAWGDNRDSVISEINGEEALYPDPNVYFDRITFGTDEGSGEESGGDIREDSGSGGDVGTGSGGPGDGTGTGGGDGGAPAVGGQDTSTPLEACDDLPGKHVIGTPGRDVLRGTAGPDVLCGLGGRDRLIGLKGDDVLLGGTGRDVLFGGRGFDVCLGGTGHDDLRGCERRLRRGPAFS